MNKAKALVEELATISGIAINGKNPWDIQVHNEAFYDRVVQHGDMGLGEAYMQGWWDSERLDLTIDKVIRAELWRMLPRSPKWLWRLFVARCFNFQSKKRAFEVGQVHYDIGNDLFQAMLDDSMSYSCGYWKGARTLDEAQRNKLKLVCEKLQLKPGMRVLDIGCGWGGLAKYMVEHHDVSVVGVTVSEEQAKFARHWCYDLPIDIRLQDYRALNESFDRIVSVGMFEHVGRKNYRTYFDTVYRCLEDDGLFLLHTIGGNESMLDSHSWVVKYIFPNGMIPSIAQIGKASEKRLVMEDWQNFGPDYYQTLMAWHENFINAWPTLKAHYDETFFRMWDYYLQICAGTFKGRSLQLWQVVFSKQGLNARYDAPR